MRFPKIILASLMLLAACNSESGKTAVPDANGRIPQKTMENILYDMQLADVYSLSVRADSTQNFGQKNQDSLARYYNEIFAHYGVNYEQFSKTIEWYKEHPAQFDTVYQNVLNKMSAQDERNKYNIK